MSAYECAALLVAGFIAGIVNTLAGGGSLLTVPLLVMMGLPGTDANGTNRVSVLVQSVVGAWRFRAEGIDGGEQARELLPALVVGAAVGAVAVAYVPDKLFERIFAVVMLALLVPMLRGGIGAEAQAARVPRRWSPGAKFAVFFAIGFYGGAIQAGVGILLVMALSSIGQDLVRANSTKMLVIAVFTAVAVGVFVVMRQVVWIPALVLSCSTAAGAVAGTRIAVTGGERAIRPVIAVAVVLLALRLLDAI